jgi:hypothetical protein
VDAAWRFVHVMVGLLLLAAGMGATLSFGVLAFVGFPILVVGLGVLSAAIDS